MSLRTIAIPLMDSSWMHSRTNRYVLPTSRSQADLGDLWQYTIATNQVPLYRTRFWRAEGSHSWDCVGVSDACRRISATLMPSPVVHGKREHTG